MENKLPHPFWIFVWIIGIVIAVSFISSLLGVQATGATASFTVNLIIAGTDVLLAGISTEVTSKTSGSTEVFAIGSDLTIRDYIIYQK